MAHLIVDYSANLDPVLDIDTLLAALVETAAQTGVFPLAGLRARAIRCDNYYIADGHPDNTFVNLSVRIGPGREAPVRKAAAEQLMATLTETLRPIHESQAIGISFEMRELDAIRFNHNNLRDYIAER